MLHSFYACRWRQLVLQALDNKAEWWCVVFNFYVCLSVLLYTCISICFLETWANYVSLYTSCLLDLHPPTNHLDESPEWRNNGDWQLITILDPDWMRASEVFKISLLRICNENKNCGRHDDTATHIVYSRWRFDWLTPPTGVHDATTRYLIRNVVM